MSEKGRGKILYLLILLMVTAATLPLLLVSYSLISSYRETLERDQQLLQLQIGQRLAARVAGYIESCQLQAELIGRAWSGTALPAGDLLRGNPGLLHIKLADSSGAVITAGAAIEDGGIEQLCDRALTSALNAQATLGSPARGARGWLAVLGLPIASGRAAAAVIDLGPVFGLVEESSLPGQTAYLVDSEGKVIAHPDKSRLGASADPEISAELVKLSGMLTSTRHYSRESDGEQILATAVPVPNTNWGVVVEALEAVAYQPVTEMIWSAAGLTVAAALLACLLAFFFSRRISGPIRLLADTTRSIAAGDFSRRVQTRARNELGELAENFNRMADKIQGYVERLEKAAMEYKQLFMGSISALAAAIDEKDPYTRGHSERVSNYAVEIGRALGLDENELERVKIAALLHDVGKIGIEDHILKKPAKFTPEEYEIMKQHPVKGAHIMSQIPQLAGIVPAMRAHHERFDGSGYPYGLKGEEIPLVARIIAVADCFDAMTLKRIYQQEFKVDLVLEQIVEWAGSRYDPKVVGALLRAYREGKIKVPRPERQAEA